MWDTTVISYNIALLKGVNQKCSQVLLDELEVGLVGADRVEQVVLHDVFLGVADERANGFNARGALQVLVLDLLVDQLHRGLVAAHAQGVEDAHEHLLEALEVPVLVDGRVDDPRREHLLRLEGEQENEVVHRVYLLVVVDDRDEVLGEDLLEEKVEDGGELLGKLAVLARPLEGALDLVGQGAHGRHDEWLGDFVGHL